MRKIPCELTLGNGGDVIVMARLDESGTLHVPRFALYGSFREGVISHKVLRPGDQETVLQVVQVDE